MISNDRPLSWLVRGNPAHEVLTFDLLPAGEVDAQVWGVEVMVRTEAQRTELVQLLEQWNRNVDPWLAADVLLPPPLTLVLVYFATGDQRVGQWSVESKRWHPPKLDRNFRHAPTHWRPLPAGPRV